MQHRIEEKKDVKPAENELIDKFDCHISGRTMEKPVVSSTGHSFSEEAIKGYIHFRLSHNLDCKEPFARDRDIDLRENMLIPNHALKLALQECRQLENAAGIKALYIRTALEWLRMDDGISHTGRLKKTVWPFALICPLSLQVFKNPVITPEGHTYERDSYIKLTKNQAIPNLRLKDIVDAFDFKPLQTEDFAKILMAIQKRFHKNIMAKQQQEQLRLQEQHQLQEQQQKKRARRANLFKLIRLGAGVATIGYLFQSCYSIFQEDKATEAFQLEQLRSPALLPPPSQVAFIGKELLKPLVLGAISCFKTDIFWWPDCGMHNAFKNDLKTCSTESKPFNNCNSVLKTAIAGRRFDFIYEAFKQVEAGTFEFTSFLTQLSYAIVMHDHTAIRFLAMVDPAILKRATGLLACVVENQREEIFNVLMQYDIPLDDSLEHPLEATGHFFWPVTSWRREISSNSGALHLAIWHNRVDWINLLAKRGANINLQVGNGRCPTPLGRAIEWDRVDAIDVLINLNAELIYAHNYPLLTYAFEHGKEAFLTKYIHLLNEQVDQLQPNYFERWAINIFQNGNLSMANLLINHALTPQTVTRLDIVINEALKKGSVLDISALIKKLNTISPTLTVDPLIKTMKISMDTINRLNRDEHKPSESSLSSSTLLDRGKNTIKDFMQAFIPIFKQQLATAQHVQLLYRLMYLDLDLFDTFLSVGAPILDHQNNVSVLKNAIIEDRLDALKIILKYNPDFSEPAHATVFDAIKNYSNEKNIIELILSVKNQSLLDGLAKGKYEKYLLSLIERNEGDLLDLFLRAGATPHGVYKHYSLLETAILHHQQFSDSRALKILARNGADIAGLRKLYLSDIEKHAALTASTKEAGLFKPVVDEKIYLAAEKARKALQTIDDVFTYKPSTNSLSLI